MYENTLKSCGLSVNEVKIFLTVLMNGPTPASTLAKRCNLQRHTTYQAIETLRTRGLMGFTIKNSVRYFTAIDPEILLERCEKEIIFAKRKTAEITQMLNEIKTIRYTTEHSFDVMCLDGSEAIKSVYDDILRERKPYLNFSYGIPLFQMDPDAYQYFHRKRVALKLGMKKIMPLPQNTEEDPRKIKFELRDVRYLPREKFPLTCDIRIYGDKVALIDNTNTNPHAVIIKNAPIAKTFTVIFELSWEKAFDYAHERKSV